MCCQMFAGILLDRTINMRPNSDAETKRPLLLSYAPPYKPVGTATIARYIKQFLGMAGIDITVFTAHSTRSASTSKANNLGITIRDIQKAAGWTSENTFRKFYNLPVANNFGTQLLERTFKN